VKEFPSSKIASSGLKAAVLAAFLVMAGVLTLQAAYLKDVPIVLHQPNGDVVKVLVTGDEFYRTVHDAEGFTILQHPNGFYVYAMEQAGRVVPSGYRVGTVNPALLGIPRNLRPSLDQLAPPSQRMPFGSPANPKEIDAAPTTGTINNLVIFIRFSDQAEYTGNISTYDASFNSSTAGANSMYNYFREVSYNALSISTTFYPVPPGATVVSYQDSHVRAYFSPYNASTNPIGYSGDAQRTSREHTLLRDAVNAVSSQVPVGLNLDGDVDGRVDNVCFIIRGGTDAWADLLWPHMWSLYSYTVNINGKRVYTYNFQLETSFGVRVLCHEMFHSLGSPDLYHYTNNGIYPVWYWDIMEYGSGHMGAHMKWDYGKWISSIPTITTSGTYTLNPLTSSTGQAYKILSPYVTGQYFVVEYRVKTGTFEGNLPGTGLLVYRINSAVYGNASGPPDEVYIYRPNGTTTTNGDPNIAHFSSGVGRTAINDTTNPRSFLADGSDGGLDISSVSAAGSTISFYVNIPGSATLTLGAPNGGESWQALTSHNITWSSTGSITNVKLEYSTNGGSNWTTIIGSTPNDGSYTWTVANAPSTTCRVRVSDAASGTPSDTSDANFTISAPAAETVSTPTTPTGAASPQATLPYNYTSGGSTSSWADPVQYYFDYGDGTNSGWLPVGTTSVAKRWAAVGSYSLTVKARCSVHTATESAFSTALAVNVSAAPASLIVLPEVIWASATGGGTWVSEVQVTDITGGSQAWVCFNMTGGTWRGPFLLWTGGAAGSSAKFANILSELQTLDPTFTYYGQVGALEVWTQPGSYNVRVAARTLNGNYSKTFPGLKFEPWNSAATSRPMLIQNMMSNATYRSSAGFFNPTGDAVTADFQLLDSGGGLVGSAFSRSFVAYDFQSFNPFAQAGVPYPTYSYDNVCLRVIPTSGTGVLFGFGAAANNTSNDPAAQLAVQDAGTYVNSPNRWMYLPEAIWAEATGGGTWTTEIQITDVTGASQVSATFYWGGASRGPFLLWTGGGAHSSAKFTNLLSTLQSIDSSYTYYGKVGAVVFSTQDGSHTIHVTSLTKNGNYSKTFPGLTNYSECTVGTGRDLMIQNLTSNAAYRSSIGFFNGSAGALTVEFRLYNSAGSLIGSMFSQTINAGGFYSINPFAAAGVPYPTYSYDNVWLLITPTSGTGTLYGYGATANNTSNDPAAHIAVIHHWWD
jgi:M6 family metalloprotease-like protein